MELNKSVIVIFQMILFMFISYKLFESVDINSALRLLANIELNVVLISLVAAILGGLLAIMLEYLFRKYKPNKPYVLISSSREDKKLALQIKHDLNNLNIDLDVSLIEEVVQVGESINDRLNEEFSRAEYIILIISESYLQSYFSEKELDYFVTNKKKILPIVLGNNEIPYQLKDKVYLKHMEEDYKNTISILMNSLISLYKKDKYLK
jgi:hypothetical protein